MSDPSPVTKKPRLSLANRILLPFLVILLLLGVSATFGSVGLIRQTLTRTAEGRLRLAQQYIFHEIKERERLLNNYADLLEYARVDLPDKPWVPSPRPNNFARLLREMNVSAHLFAAGRWDKAATPALQALLEQAARSERPRFRFLAPQSSAPKLAVAVPYHLNSGHGQLALLQTPLGADLLQNLSHPFRTSTDLLSMTGKLIVADPAQQRMDPEPGLSPAELKQVATGHPLFKTTGNGRAYRHLYYAVPLGSTDLIILDTAMPLSGLELIVHTLATRSLLTILLALLIGAYLYFRIIRQIMAPLQDLLRATHAVSEGNLDYRIARVDGSELGQVAGSFNTMVAQLSTLYQEKMAQARDLTLAREEVRYKELLEAKNRQIEETNRELKAHVHELSALYKLNQAMITTLDVNLLFDRMLTTLQDLIHCEEMLLLLYNPGTEELEVRCSLGVDQELLKGVIFRLDDRVTGLAASSKELIYLPDLAVDPRAVNERARSFNGGAMVSAPMVVQHGLIGVLNLYKRQIDSFSPSELNLIQAVANQAAIYIENAQLFEKNRYLSNTDELTNLANRRYFQEILKRELAQARRFKTPFSLIMVDIDHFKRFNDTHGHLRGDIVLKRVAAHLLRNTRGIDLVGRFGGEEFIVLLPKTTKEGAFTAAEKLRQELAREEFPGAEQSQPGGRLTLSLGLAEYPTDSRDIHQLLECADRALYAAKEGGRNRTVAWNAETCQLPLFALPADGIQPPE